tara:strand:- start:1023 stop:1442 length:420 start_codon:yes stop_codon:yes gene_type:complete
LKKKISDKDKKVWEEFINSKDKLENKDIHLSKKYTDNQIVLDLHGYTIRDANIAVKNLIIKSYNDGKKKVKIITGKGMRSKNLESPYKSKDLSILKYSVPDFVLSQKELMEKIKKIDIDSVNNLNSGEFSIHLKKKNET